MMNSNQPYLIRAYYDWIVDSSCTPYIVVDATLAGVSVPLDHIQDGKIILNIAMRSVEGLSLGNEWLTFHARFSGQSVYIEVPIYAVQAIYAKENGEGISFQSSLSASGSASSEQKFASDSQKPEKSKKPTLTVVK